MNGAPYGAYYEIVRSFSLGGAALNQMKYVCAYRVFILIICPLLLIVCHCLML